MKPTTKQVDAVAEVLAGYVIDTPERARTRARAAIAAWEQVRSPTIPARQAAPGEASRAEREMNNARDPNDQMLEEFEAILVQELIPRAGHGEAFLGILACTKGDHIAIKSISGHGDNPVLTSGLVGAVQRAVLRQIESLANKTDNPGLFRVLVARAIDAPPPDGRDVQREITR